MISANLILATAPASWGQVALLGLLSGAGAQSSLVASAAILVLFVLIVGGYILWRRSRARRDRQKLSTAIEAQASLAPKALSDPNQRAALDKLRQKFETGLEEFQSRGKDLFKLPWYLIIGEPGSGKTEAIRHSGIEFPTGLQNELQGSGGTVNMDWWFTNHGVILDTAGRLVFNESPAGRSPEWTEFLRLLKDARYHCPINGLFIVLSIESLIKDSADQVAHKARRLAQQLDLIQRTLDVRFPVYLLVTKSDLLAGFREFFASVDDPLLRHQLFGWSNSDPLDAPFRPELIGQHLAILAQSLRRRRLALLREAADRQLQGARGLAVNSERPTSTSSTLRPADEVEALFALPESIMRLTPRLHRYVETLFTAGEWSAKPVFLRGVYFTSSMTEGKILDEAIAFATGLSIDQLPEESRLASSRAYFLRDLFVDKVFKESGLVTRASNTAKLLRARQLAVWTAVGTAACLFLGFSFLGYSKLKQAVLDEKDYWSVAAKGVINGVWSPPIVSAGEDGATAYSYRGHEVVPTSGHPTLVQYHAQLKDLVQHDLAGGWIFKPISWVVPGGFNSRPAAQRIVFEKWLLGPVVQQVRAKMLRTSPKAADSGSLARHEEALLNLIQFEGDELAGDFLAPANASEKYWRAFLSYLTEKDFRPDPLLVEVMAQTYSSAGKHRNGGRWPPLELSGGNTLSVNKPLETGISKFCAAALQVEQGLLRQLGLLDTWVDKLQAYRNAEENWFSASADPCLSLRQELLSAKFGLDAAWVPLRNLTNSPMAKATDLPSRYSALETAASNTSPAAITDLTQGIVGRLADSAKTNGLFQEVQELLGQFVFKGAREVQNSYYHRQRLLPLLERDHLVIASSKPAWESRWNLYGQACLLGSTNPAVSPNEIGRAWRLLDSWTNKLGQFQRDLAKYSGPLKDQVDKACSNITFHADQNLKRRLAQEYAAVIVAQQAELANRLADLKGLAGRREWFSNVEQDLSTSNALGDQASVLQPVQESLAEAKRHTLVQLTDFVRSEMGFPVIASATQMMDGKNLSAARELLDRLNTELSTPVWSARPELTQELTQIQQELKRHKAILASLTGKDQRVAQVQINIVPYEKLAPQDRKAVSTFRWIQVAEGPGTNSEDLTRSFQPLATQPADRAITLVFRDNSAGPPLRQEKLEPWWLLRAVRDGKAEPLGDGNTWTIRIPIKDPGRKVDGNAVFEVRLVSEAQFPARDNWVK